MPDSVFISYAKEDRRVAERLHRDLKSAGIVPWLDIHDLLPGQHWEIEVEAAIRRCRYFIALQSALSVGKKGHVQKELRRALEIAEEYKEDEVFIIPVRIDDCEPSFRALSSLHRVDLFPFYNDGMESLLRLFTYTSDEKPNIDYLEEHSRYGEVRTLSDRGLGLLKLLPHGHDVFFHHSELKGVLFEELRPGDLLEFMLARGQRGWLATSVMRV
jgi:cold shock CspA family protein